MTFFLVVVVVVFVLPLPVPRKSYPRSTHTLELILNLGDAPQWSHSDVTMMAHHRPLTPHRKWFGAPWKRGLQATGDILKFERKGGTKHSSPFHISHVLRLMNAIQIRFYLIYFSNIQFSVNCWRIHIFFSHYLTLLDSEYHHEYKWLNVSYTHHCSNGALQHCTT